jgi:DNA-binding SARP family transcriptional activator
MSAKGVDGVTWFGVLGPLEVTAGGSPVPVIGRRQRELLAVLLLRANQPVSVDLLVDMIWPDRPPASAHRQVQNGVGRLRRTLTTGGVRPDVIETRPGGYLLRIGADGLDALAFATHVAMGKQAAADRLADAVVSLRAALALWRGPPLADIDDHLVAREAHLLDEQRVAVLEDCVELELRLGRHDEVVNELTSLVREHPLRERLWALLMVALYRTGRKAEALAAYRLARSKFVTELGLEPGLELQALEQAILSGAGAIDFVRQEQPRPRQLPPDTVDFTGRDEIVTELDGLFRAGRHGPAVVIAAIAGKAGVGKTTLAVHVAHRVLDVFPDGQLYVNLLGGGQDQRAEPVEVLARFLRALGTAGSAIPDGLEERAELYRSRLGDRQVLVVLDNAVDESQVRPLLPGGAGCGVLVTSRSRMAALPGARPVLLDVLQPAQALELLSRITGAQRIAAETKAACDLIRLCGLLPLALRIVGARLLARPDLTLTGMAARLVDESTRLTELTYGDLEVRASLSVSYRGLGPRARRLFHLLGLLDAPDVAGWVCGAVLDLTADSADELIEALTDAQLLEMPRRDATGRPRYRLHDLVRLYARERASESESPAARTAAIARALGGWLALVQRAHIALSGGDFVTMHGTSVHWKPAVEGLGSVIDEDPLTWYETERLAIVAGVRQAADHGLDELCWELAISSYALFLTRGHYDDWTDTHTRALAATRGAGNRRGMAAVLLGLGALQAYRRNHVEAAELLDASVSALRKLDDPRGLSYALGTAAHVDGMRGRYELAIARHQESIAVYREVGDPLAEIIGLRALGKLLVDIGRLEEARLILDRAMVMGRRGDRRAYAEVLYTLGQLYLASGDTARAELAFRDVLAVSEQIGDPRGAASAWQGFGLVRLAKGALVEAATVLSQALVLNQRLGAVLTEGRIRLSLGEVHRRSGRLDEAEHHLEQAVRIFTASQTPLWHARALSALGDVHLGCGATAAARAAWSRAHALFDEVGSVEAGQLAAKLGRPQFAICDGFMTDPPTLGAS